MPDARPNVVAAWSTTPPQVERGPERAIRFAFRECENSQATPNSNGWLDLMGGSGQLSTDSGLRVLATRCSKEVTEQGNLGRMVDHLVQHVKGEASLVRLGIHPSDGPKRLARVRVGQRR